MNKETEPEETEWARVISKIPFYLTSPTAEIIRWTLELIYILNKKHGSLSHLLLYIYIAFNSFQEMGSKRFVGFLDHFTALAL